MLGSVASLLGVGLGYDKNSPLFKGVNIEIKRGSFHFLTGMSGSGKSSFLKLLYLGMKPSWGTIKLFDQNITNITKSELPLFRQRIGVIFQEFKLLNHLSVIDNVALPLMVRGTNRKQSFNQAQEILKWVELENVLNAYPETLSGGQKQRVAIARAVITKPQLLLADEPTGNVDDEIALKLLYLFEELNRLGTSIIIASHNKTLIKRFSHPELNITQGQIIEINHSHPHQEAKS